MKRQPAAGIIPPHGAVRVIYNPNLESDEQPMVMTTSGAGSIAMEITPAAVILTNLTDKLAPFLLLIVTPQQTSLHVIFDYLKDRLGG